MRMRKQLELCESILMDVINQACYDEKEGVFDSLALTDYAVAMKYLAGKGYLEITSQYGRRVIAKPTKKLEELWGVKGAYKKAYP